MAGFNILDPKLSVASSTFLEASAGTGKTFALVMLALRLLAKEKGAKIDEILIVTFTKAACTELKMRLFEALQQTLKLETLPPHLRSPGAKERLKEALIGFDEAKIFTIHGFCAQLLNEYPFLGDVSLEIEEKQNNKELAMSAKDCLRGGLEPSFISQSQLALLFRTYGPSIESVVQAITGLVSRGLPIDGGEDFETSFQAFKKLCVALDAASLDPAFVLEDLINLAGCFTGLCDKYKRVKKEVNQAFQSISTVFGARPLFFESFEALISNGVASLLKMTDTNRKKRGEISKLHYPTLLAEIQKYLCPVVERASDPMGILGRVAEKVRIQIEKKEVIFYDDLLKKVAKLARKPEQAELIANNYKAVLIDEFQDTDPLQWEIFKNFFCTSSYEGSVYFVGDPKQSIYRFRLADIYTYLEAKKHFDDTQIATLNTNFRSSRPLIIALNALFADCENFIALPKLNAFITCSPVLASTEAKPHSFQDGLGALHFFTGPTEQKLFAFTVSEIKRLHLKFGVSLEGFAVLVKDRYQANRFKALCDQVSLPSVTKRSRSLLRSLALPLMNELIAAILHPKDLRLLAKVLGGPLFGWNCSQLADLAENLEAIVNQFYNYREVLTSKGVLFVFKRIMQTQSAILLAHRDGLALYSDLLQLAEMTEEERVPIDCLYSYFEGLKREDSEVERFKARELSSTTAVQIMTIHMSKGLEFEVVFPLGLVVSTPSKKEFLPKENRLVLDENEQIEHQKECDAEKMRQLYVACTRAKKRLYLPVLKGKTCFSPMELFLNKRLKQDSLENWIQPHASVISFSQCAETPFYHQSVGSQESLYTAPSTIRGLYPPLGIHSFSSLAPHDSESEPLEVPENTLPVGAETGTLLHDLLENLSFKEAGGLNALDLSKMIAPHLKDTSLQNWAQEVTKIVYDTLHTPLPPGFTLADLDPSKIVKEMEFIYSSVEPAGFLKGFIDLIFEHEGKTYLVDYKSNWLGKSKKDYNQKALQRALLKNNYDSQEKIYRLALKKSLEIYESRPFDSLFGGSFYLFLRGLSSTTGIISLS